MNINQQIKNYLTKKSCLILNQLLTAPLIKDIALMLQQQWPNYPTKTKFAVKTGSTSFDSLCAGYNPNYTILSWTGYDDNREMNMASEF